MRYQTQANLTYKDYFEPLLSAKHEPTKSLVTAVLPTVWLRATAYSNALGGVAGLALYDWNDNDLESALVACYDSPTQALRDLKDQLVAHLEQDNVVNVRQCPYCMLNEPNTWDHYLPKTFYPEFSVLHLNLVYVCWSCNHRKREKYSQNILEYCHPSYTVIADEALLHCHVSIQNGNLAIEFYAALQDANDERARIAHRHLMNLDLIRRYKLECASVFSSFVANLARDLPEGVGEAIFKENVGKRYQAISNDFGVNYWEARFWHGIWHCAGIVDYVNTRINAYVPNIREGLEADSPPWP